MTPSGGGLSRFLVPKFIVPALIVAVLGVAVILIWFQPQKLFIDTQVDEGAPVTTIKKEESTANEVEVMSFSGNFRGVNHETSGKALLEKAEDGHYYVRLENFETENGPDLFVYLSSAPGDAEESDFPGEFIDLGKLKGNIGDQNYQVPDGTDLSKYHSVIVWCRRFNTTFGAAPLNQT